MEGAYRGNDCGFGCDSFIGNVAVRGGCEAPCARVDICRTAFAGVAARYDAEHVGSVGVVGVVGVEIGDFLGRVECLNRGIFRSCDYPQAFDSRISVGVGKCDVVDVETAVHHAHCHTFAGVGVVEAGAGVSVVNTADGACAVEKRPFGIAEGDAFDVGKLCEFGQFEGIERNHCHIVDGADHLIAFGCESVGNVGSGIGNDVVVSEIRIGGGYVDDFSAAGSGRGRSLGLIEEKSGRSIEFALGRCSRREA